MRVPSGNGLTNVVGLANTTYPYVNVYLHVL